VKRLAIAILLLVSPATFAAWTDCVCNIQGPKYGGSGTLIAVAKNGHGLIISAAHVFEDGNTQNLFCEFPAVGKKYPAKLLAAQSRNDIAALDIASVPNVPLPGAVVAAKPADGPFVCAGFPYDSRHQLRWTRGKYCGYDGATLLTYQTVRSGFSGGGRFNRWGEYVGPISGMRGENGQRMDKCWGASGAAMLEFIGRFVEVNK
jgi:hypothetical protein